MALDRVGGRVRRRRKALGVFLTVACACDLRRDHEDHRALGPRRPARLLSGPPRARAARHPGGDQCCRGRLGANSRREILRQRHRPLAGPPLGRRPAPGLRTARDAPASAGRHGGRGREESPRVLHAWCLARGRSPLVGSLARRQRRRHRQAGRRCPPRGMVPAAVPPHRSVADDAVWQAADHAPPLAPRRRCPPFDVWRPPGPLDAAPWRGRCRRCVERPRCAPPLWRQDLRRTGHAHRPSGGDETVLPCLARRRATDPRRAPRRHAPGRHAAFPALVARLPVVGRSPRRTRAALRPRRDHLPIR